MAMILSKLIASAFLLSLCLIVTQTGATDVKYCTKRDYNVKVSGVEISPNPVARGAPATFTISATTGEAISGGKVEIEVSYFGLHVHSETHDLCEESSCPVAEGDFILSHTQVLPGYTPPGAYSLRMTMTDDKKTQLTCITFKFNIGLLADS
ncbi:MD-2-related lipid recognition domain-containing protein [Euphorbia peplus]|nr:MD-2-related lipid recognition domain-containing protein [Euphorbia peplus]